MSQNVEAAYDSFLSNMSNLLRKISAELAMRIMYYERKFPQSDPCVDLDIHYKDGTILEKNKLNLVTSMGLVVQKWEKIIC